MNRRHPRSNRTASLFPYTTLLRSGSAAIPAWAIDGIEREFGIEIINFFGSNEGTSLLSTPREVPDPAMRATLFPRFGRPYMGWQRQAHGPSVQQEIGRAHV